MTSSTYLLLSLAIGLPLILLALGVFYHAWVIARQPAAEPLDAHVESAATRQTEELIGELHRTMEQVRAQLTQQRHTLTSMLGGASSAASTVPPTAQPAAAQSWREYRPPEDESDPRAAVRRLAAEGLSDRAIARRLRIGLEEVRMMRTRGGGRS